MKCILSSQVLRKCGLPVGVWLVRVFFLIIQITLICPIYNVMSHKLERSLFPWWREKLWNRWVSALTVARKHEEASLLTTLLVKAGAVSWQAAYGPPETALWAAGGSWGNRWGTTGVGEEAIKTHECRRELELQKDKISYSFTEKEKKMQAPRNTFCEFTEDPSKIWKQKEHNF